MAFTIDRNLLDRLTIAIISGIIVIGVLIVLGMTGILGGGDPEISGHDNESSVVQAGLHPNIPTEFRKPASETVSKDTGKKKIELNWEYKEHSFNYSCNVRNTTYQRFKLNNSAYSPGMTTGEIIALYVVTGRDDGLINGIADYILKESEQNGWGDYDAIMNSVACVQQYGPGKFVNTPYNGQYRYPVVTLWEEEGSRDDINILSASILKAMGYPAGFLIFPEQYDRGHLIWEYPAVCIRCEDDVPGKSYISRKQKEVGTVTCYPHSKTCNAPGMPSFSPESGYLTGNTTVGYTGGETIAAGEGVWDISAGNMALNDVFSSPAGMTAVFYRMENASWVTEESFIYIDALNATALPGEIPGELVRSEPEIVTTLIDPVNDIAITRDDIIDSSLTPVLRVPSPLKTGVWPELCEKIPERLGIPVPGGMVSEENERNKIRGDEYWQDVWYDTEVTFYDQTWYLNVINYEIIENQPLYTISNEMYISPTEAWRIKYEAVPVNPPDKDLEGLSSFSDMRFAVYKVDEGEGLATFVGEFAYGHTSGQESVNYLNFYETGNFYIVTFVRNCEAKVSIQMHGKGSV